MTDFDSTEYYHGTTLKGIVGIIRSRSIYTEYFGEEGCYITGNIYHAINHGCWVLCIEASDLNINNLSTDDINDGIYHKGRLNLSLPLKIRPSVRDDSDYRLLDDILLLEDVNWQL